MKKVTITNPDGGKDIRRYQKNFNEFEGLIVSSELTASDGASLQKIQNTYATGSYYGKFNNNATNMRRTTRAPQLLAQTITRGSSVYSKAYSGFDAFGMPSTITESNNYSSIEKQAVRSYQNDIANWLIGLLTAESINQVQSRTYAYTTFGQIASESEFGLPKATFTYDANGRLATHADALSRTNTYSNYYRGVPQQITLADGYSASRTVNYFGEPMSTTDRRGYITSYTRDSLGRLASANYPAGDVQQWAPTNITNGPISVSELGRPVGTWRTRRVTGRIQQSVYYNALLLPHLIEERDLIDGTARYLQKTYDHEGRVLFKSYPSSVNANFAGINYTYDALGRVLTEKTSDGVTLQSFVYLSGNRRRTTDAAGNVTVHTYQAFGEPDYTNITRIEAPEGQTTVIDRDAFGNIINVTQSDGASSLTRNYIYDAHMRLCKRIDPESGQAVMAYDAANQLSWSANGQLGSATACDYANVPSDDRTQYGYSSIGLRTSIDYPGAASDVSMEYDLDGHLTSIVNPIMNWSYLWNRRGLLESETAVIDGKTFTLDPSYDSHGLLANMVYPDGLSFNYAPNASGLPTRVGDIAGSIQYHANGIPSSYSLGNGLAYSGTLNSRQWPETLQVSGGSGLLQRLTYGYNADSDITSINDGINGSENVTAGYDGLHRLTQASGAWGLSTISYDAFNNIQSRTLPSQTLVYSYDSANRVAQLDIDGAAYTYGYDSRGHTTTDGRRTYLWNEAEQISGITGMSDYSYDGHGKRVKTVLAGGSVEYSIYNLAGQLMHTEKDGVKTDFLSLNGKPLAEIRTAGSATSTKYLHPDISGSPRLATDASGVLLWRESYTPYGEKLNATEGKTGYTGHAYDAESGLVYMQARYYDPQLARFLSTDPVGFDPGNTFSFSRYAYANNNPYRYIDPDGRDNVAVVTGSRLSTSNDISHWRGQYTIHEYSVYRTPNGTPAWAANLVGRVLGDKVGSFEVSWNARSSDARNRGTVLGDSSKIAEVSLGEGRHPIQVTDIGRAKEDVLTQVTNGETIMRTQIRLHSGGPYFSLGCGVTCDTKSKLTTESNLISNMPALGNLGETTYISLPAKED